MRAAVEQILDVGQVGAEILGMGDALVSALDQLVALMPGDFAELVVDHDEGPVGRDVGDAHGGLVEGGLEALVRLGARAFAFRVRIAGEALGDQAGKQLERQQIAVAESRRHPRMQPQQSDMAAFEGDRRIDGRTRPAAPLLRDRAEARQDAGGMRAGAAFPGGKAERGAADEFVAFEQFHLAAFGAPDQADRAVQHDPQHAVEIVPGRAHRGLDRQQFAWPARHSGEVVAAVDGRAGYFPKFPHQACLRCDRPKWTKSKAARLTGCK